MKSVAPSGTNTFSSQTTYILPVGNNLVMYSPTCPYIELPILLTRTQLYGRPLEIEQPRI